MILFIPLPTSSADRPGPRGLTLCGQGGKNTVTENMFAGCAVLLSAASVAALFSALPVKKHPREEGTKPRFRPGVETRTG